MAEESKDGLATKADLIMIYNKLGETHGAVERVEGKFDQHIENSKSNWTSYGVIGSLLLGAWTFLTKS